MELVIDAAILFSFFKPESFTRDFVKLLYSNGVRLFAPDFLLDELLSLKERISKFCRIDEERQFYNLFYTPMRGIRCYTEVRI
ncbi:hypothetical protein C5S32_11000 [ANME-1 cluster archaeon GoMg1]|nr:hypothetical protein [ANME-1 cluster archaeon GoMg1]